MKQIGEIGSDIFSVQYYQQRLAKRNGGVIPVKSIATEREFKRFGILPETAASAARLYAFFYAMNQRTGDGRKPWVVEYGISEENRFCMFVKNGAGKAEEWIAFTRDELLFFFKGQEIESEPGDDIFSR